MTLGRRIARLGRWLVAVVLRATGGLAWLRRRRARRGEVIVLAFHRIGETAGPLMVPDAVFRRIVSGLARRYRIASWGECVQATHQRGRPTRVALTFDDGHRDGFERAWPRIRAAGATALFFPTTSFLDGVPLWWELVAARHGPRDRSPAGFGPGAEEEIARLKSSSSRELLAYVDELRDEIAPEALAVPLSWSDAKRMVDEGAEFGGHGVSHSMLPRCSDEDLRRELMDCRHALGTRLGRDIRLFAYPDGSHDQRVVDAVRDAGFRYAFAGGPGSFSEATDPLRIPRRAVDGSVYSVAGRFSWSLFEASILGVFDHSRSADG